MSDLPSETSMSAPIYNLPPSLVDLLAEHIPTTDLKNLRLANHWTQKQTFRAFARRCNVVYLNLSSPKSVDKLKQKLQIQEIAAAIDTLVLKADDDIRPHYASSQPAGAPPVEDVPVLEWVGRMRKLSHLGFWNFAGSILEMHLPAQTLKTALQANGNSRIRQLTLRNIVIRSKQLIALLDSTMAAGLPGLSLELSEIIIEDEDWVQGWADVFRAIRDLRVTKLQVFQLYGSPIMRTTPEGPVAFRPSLGIFDDGSDDATRRFQKAIRGKDGKGIETYVVWRNSMQMYGVEAMQVGLEYVLEKVGGQ
jgi:hypothetical protein